MRSRLPLFVTVAALGLSLAACSDTPFNKTAQASMPPGNTLGPKHGVTPAPLSPVPVDPNEVHIVPQPMATLAPPAPLAGSGGPQGVSSTAPPNVGAFAKPSSTPTTTAGSQPLVTHTPSPPQ